MSDARDIIATMLDVHPVHVMCVPDSKRPDRNRLVVRTSVNVNYETLAKLAAALGTTDINFVYEEGEPGYSSYTPGSDGWFELSIGSPAWTKTP